MCILQAESKSDGEGSALGQDGHIVIIMRHIIGHHSDGMASDGYIGTSSDVESYHNGDSPYCVQPNPLSLMHNHPHHRLAGKGKAGHPHN